MKKILIASAAAALTLVGCEKNAPDTATPADAADAVEADADAATDDVTDVADDSEEATEEATDETTEEPAEEAAPEE